MNSSEDNSEITLGVLNAVEENSRVTQRDVAKNIGIALGLTNAYLKRCIKKGLIKVQQAPANRYAYYLTPQGFAEKSRLTGEYLAQGFQFFRVARQEVMGLLEECQKREWSKIALYGLTELAEVAVLVSINFEIEIIGIVDKSSSQEAYAEKEIVRDLSDLNGVDAVILTDLGDPQSSYNQIIKVLPNNRVLTPNMLNISRIEDYSK